jgi:hypothetical protein
MGPQDTTDQPQTGPTEIDVRVPVQEVMTKLVEQYQQIIASLVRQNAVMQAAYERTMNDLAEIRSQLAALQMVEAEDAEQVSGGQ